MMMRRWEIINKLIERYSFESYLEIGVFQKENFNKINCKLKHCVDPNFESTFQITSDKFFYLNKETYDLIFIDGLHTGEQTYKDLCNAYEALNPGGFIVVHDCNPATEWHTRPVEQYKRGEEWNGTTYKGFIRFKQERPLLTCYTVDTDYGCGIITDRFDKSREITWEEFDKNRKELLGLVSEFLV